MLSKSSKTTTSCITVFKFKVDLVSKKTSDFHCSNKLIKINIMSCKQALT